MWSYVTKDLCDHGDVFIQAILRGYSQASIQ